MDTLVQKSSKVFVTVIFLVALELVAGCSMNLSPQEEEEE
jgi:hypothetical protein